MLQYLRKAGPFSAGTIENAVNDDRPPSAEEIAQRVVAVATAWNGSTELHVHLTISPGFHIQAHDVPGDLPLIATTLSVQDDPAAVVEYPPGEELKTPFADRPLQIYGGEVELVVRLSQLRRNGSKIVLRLAYQACDDSACLAPTVKVIAAGE